MWSLVSSLALWCSIEGLNHRGSEGLEEAQDRLFQSLNPLIPQSLNPSIPQSPCDAFDLHQQIRAAQVGTNVLDVVQMREGGGDALRDGRAVGLVDVVDAQALEV